MKKVSLILLLISMSTISPAARAAAGTSTRASFATTKKSVIPGKGTIAPLSEHQAAVLKLKQCFLADSRNFLLLQAHCRKGRAHVIAFRDSLSKAELTKEASTLIAHYISNIESLNKAITKGLAAYSELLTLFEAFGNKPSCATYTAALEFRETTWTRTCREIDAIELEVKGQAKELSSLVRTITEKRTEVATTAQTIKARENAALIRARQVSIGFLPIIEK